MSHKFTDFPKLNDTTKELITLGNFSFYKLENGEYLLITSGPPICGCGHSETNHYYKVDEQGNVIEQVDKQPDLKFVESIRFELPDHITKNYIKVKL